MKVSIYTVFVDERARLAINHQAGVEGMATRAQVRAFYAGAGDDAIAAACVEWDLIQTPRLPFDSNATPEAASDSPAV